jgi:hypothetical protein
MPEIHQTPYFQICLPADIGMVLVGGAPFGFGFTKGAGFNSPCPIEHQQRVFSRSLRLT